ncbi:Leucine-rich repeat-containing protein 24-like protein [Dinothrombium tinctorium]|uniref:Leucine-rich repeat-containing protein 24-like protein n=1 Tax=Dinothrombium tinctorium TaxID=1965070 RepID=A0A3S3PKY9_9ACAR|nr:Leucine-rich repeat-containing protein 24-like protein [Dinothrombium tinctorium]RWS11818.1 Leucine-rich repeat-containing protein 24-like protein [Dinothrombium tinctorium]
MRDPTEEHLDIQVINLTRNNFGELRKNIFNNAKLLNLQRIFLRKAGLESIDKLAFNRLANLIELDLSWNTLRSIPSDSFESIVNLRTLDLSSNQIDVLEASSFRHLQKLKKLYLER